MKQINVAMIPEVLAGIVKQLEVIDGWLSLKTEPVLNGTIGPHEDWIDIYELRRLIPGSPKLETVRSWLYFHGIPHYKSQRYGIGDYWTKKRKYREEEW